MVDRASAFSVWMGVSWACCNLLVGRAVAESIPLKVASTAGDVIEPNLVDLNHPVVPGLLNHIELSQSVDAPGQASPLLQPPVTVSLPHWDLVLPKLSGERDEIISGSAPMEPIDSLNSSEDALQPGIGDGSEKSPPQSVEGPKDGLPPTQWDVTLWGGQMTYAGATSTNLFLLRGEPRPEYLYGIGIQRHLWRTGSFVMSLEADLMLHKSYNQPRYSNKVLGLNKGTSKYCHF